MLTSMTFQSAVALVWSISESVCLMVLKGHRGVHPGAIVGVDLIIWLSLVGGAIAVGIFRTSLYYVTGWTSSGGTQVDAWGDRLDAVAARNVQALVGLCSFLA